VAPILDAAGVDWKILLLNGEGISTTDNPAIKWDGTKTASDRDQRGKELCVYMRRDTVTQRYEKTPLEWRNLMLSCWQALETAGVQYGYMPAPYGDKPITLDNSFPTPFSYTSNKGYDDRDGVLKKGNFNPHQTDGSNDPLYGMQISSAALQRFNIAPGTTLVLLKRQQEYLTQHYATQVPIVRESFAAITTDTTWQQRALSNLAEISQLVAPSASEELDVAGYQRQIATNKAQIDELMKAFIENTPPSVEKESLTSSKIAEYIESLLKTFNKEVNHPKANAADITDAYNKLFAAIKLTEHALSSGADKAADVNLGEHQERFDEI